MNFVAQLEDHLRDLGAEARKKHPGVKEASERAILRLRLLKNEYVGAVRKSSTDGEKHPSTSIFRSSDLLHPFLLATNYPNASAKLLDTSFKAMKILMEADAICAGDGMNLVRVWMIQAQVVVSYSTKEGNPKMSSSTKSATSSASNELDSEKRNNSHMTSSWLGTFLQPAAAAKETAARAMTVATKAAVSSSHGQAGSGHLSAKDLEKLALDILSCLLKLLELRGLPISTEQWTQSVALCCLLYLPSRRTVRQAAHSTLPQVLSLLIKNKESEELAIATWEDLLACCSEFSLPDTSKESMSLKGAFSQCRIDDTTYIPPPSCPLSLELMSNLLTENPSTFLRVGEKTILSVVQLLQSHTNNESTSVQYLHILQFALIVLQSHVNDWPKQCEDIILCFLNPIRQTTEALREHAEFEDGAIYKTHNKTLLPQTSTVEILQGLPSTLLWKTALSIDSLKQCVESKFLLRIMGSESTTISQILETVSDFCTIGASCKEHIDLVVLACRKKSQSIAYCAENLSDVDHWRCGKTKEGTYIHGDTVWTGFIMILKIIDQSDEKLLHQTFAPSLAILQHYLKRFPASGTIVNKALEGYFSLAKISLTLPLIRRTLLTSLCKLSLPQWGTCVPTSDLRDHNIATLICLVNIVHRFFDSIKTEWLLVMQTFQELSIIPIASPDLSDSGYVGALSVSAIYSRFASFSTCLSDESFVCFVDALREVSRLVQPLPLGASPLNGKDSMAKTKKVEGGNSKEERGTIGKTIMNIGVRAIYGGSTEQDIVNHKDIPLAERTKNTFAHDYQNEFARRVASSKHPLRANQVPFISSLLVDVAMTNSFRNPSLESSIYRSLCSLATDIKRTKEFFVDAVAMLVMLNLTKNDDFPILFRGPGRVMYPDPRQNQYLAVETNEDPVKSKDTISQLALLQPLSESIINATDASVAETWVGALHGILESCGHDLNDDAWTIVIQAVASLPSNEHSSKEWSDSCLVGFRCLKLIVDDFAAVTEPSRAAQRALLDCCASFGSSLHDMNTSLTAIGLLWTIADQDNGSVSIDLALGKLVSLSTDTRAEIRNCAVNTLFSCISGRGQTFSGEQWRICLCNMVFGIFDKVTASMGTEEIVEENSKKSRYRVSVHHSRDSSDKQWVGTQALVLRGLSRVLRSFFTILLETMDDKGDTSLTAEGNPWFDGAWDMMLRYAFNAATQVGGRDTLDLRIAGIELIVLSTQLSCKQGIQAALTPARVGTNMEVVNGALRSVRIPERNSSILEPSSQWLRSDVVETWRENLFLDAFDVLESFREHLESDASYHDESNLHHSLEPTQIQVLCKFAEDMGKLYDCCKYDELFENDKFESVHDFEVLLCSPRPKVGEQDSLIARFVHIIASIVSRSSTGPDARFLSQAQRACLDIFRAMALNGSPEVILTLIELSKDGVFKERDTGCNILSYELSLVLEAAIISDGLSDETRVICMCHLLVLFENTEITEGNYQNITSTSFKKLNTLVEPTLDSAKRLEDSVDGTSTNPKSQLLVTFWGNMASTMTHIITITMDGDVELRGHLGVVIELIEMIAKHPPCYYKQAISSVFLDSLPKCMETAKASDSSVSNMGKDVLDLLGACFRVVCLCDLKDQYTQMQNVVQSILTSTISALSYFKEKNPSGNPMDDVHIQACLRICRVLVSLEDNVTQHQRQVENDHPITKNGQRTGLADRLILVCFASLCQLIGTDVTELRDAVGSLLAQVDVGRAISESESSRLKAEERAIVAEIKVVELSKEVDRLQDEKEALERQLALIY